MAVSVLPMPGAAQCHAYPVKLVPLGRGAPTVQVVLLSRKADADDRRIAALHEAIAADFTGRLPHA